MSGERNYFRVHLFYLKKKNRIRILTIEKRIYMDNIFFNAHHSPVGAYASLTLGKKGASGGLDLELGGPPERNIYFGIEGEKKDTYLALPFFSEPQEHSTQFGFEQVKPKGQRITPYQDSDIKREYALCSDTWQAGDMKVVVYSPVEPIPDPENRENDAELRRILLPAITVEFTVNNRTGTSMRTVFTGFTGNDPYTGMRHINCPETGMKGIGQGRHIAMFSNAKNVKTMIGFSAEAILADAKKGESSGGLGTTALMMFQVPPGNAATFRLALCFFRDGPATSGIDTTYWYRRYYTSIEDVGRYALEQFPVIRKRVGVCNDRFSTDHLSEERLFMLNHAIRSYYGNTQLLDNGGKPIWVVNEGNYRLINTLDLAVDHLFYEMKMHPWAVRNILDMYAKRYTYRDLVKRSDSNAKFPGGVSFTHDMGVANVFSPQGTSAYEYEHRNGCYSFMTHEQLVNWILMAGVYSLKENDIAWLEKNGDLLQECFKSLLNRDHYEVEKRNGLMNGDSTRVDGGSEITTYDSLEPSLGQARGNSYGAVKRWAAFVLMHEMFNNLAESSFATEAINNAVKVTETLQSHVNEDGMVPALLDGPTPAYTLSLIEGLIYPWFAGCTGYYNDESRFSSFIGMLKKHCITLFNKGLCQTSDKGWKLSSGSDITWSSKLYLFRFILARIFEADNEEAFHRVDMVHCSWQLDERNTLFAWSDQICNGEVVEGRYYPRGVTSILWTLEKNVF